MLVGLLSGGCLPLPLNSLPPLAQQGVITKCTDKRRDVGPQLLRVRRRLVLEQVGKVGPGALLARVQHPGQRQVRVEAAQEAVDGCRRRRHGRRRGRRVDAAEAARPIRRIGRGHGRWNVVAAMLERHPFRVHRLPLLGQVLDAARTGQHAIRGTIV